MISLINAIKKQQTKFDLLPLVGVTGF